MDQLSPQERERANASRRKTYAIEASTYDKEMDFFERRLLGTEHRGWACANAVGDTLEVALGTGLNLPNYPAQVRLTGLDLSPEMLAIAKVRAESLGRSVRFEEGDAQDLPFEDSRFDAVVCTYALCSIPDERRAISEMKRVLKPGGRLILVDHVRSTVAPVFWLQKLYESIFSRTKGEYMTRRPSLHVGRSRSRDPETRKVPSWDRGAARCVEARGRYGVKLGLRYMYCCRTDQWGAPPELGQLVLCGDLP